MSKPFRIAVFASGSGSNFQAIVDAVKQRKLDVTIELLVCDQPSAKVIDRAKQADIPQFVFRAKDYPSREAYEQDIVKELELKDIDLIVLAGYMRIITSILVEPYFGRMINIHPSLLPSFPGLNGVGQAYNYGVKVTGVTVHYVDGGMDTGPVIAQREVIIHEGESLEQLEHRIHEVEHALFPQVIDWISKDLVTVDGRKVKVNI
jgi:phosphoribosylglycinamide formyltransferase-1